MAKTLTDKMIDRMNKKCADMCRTGKCSGECLVDDAKMGWCAEVWESARRKSVTK